MSGPTLKAGDIYMKILIQVIRRLTWVKIIQVTRPTHTPGGLCQRRNLGHSTADLTHMWSVPRMTQRTAP